MNIDTFKVEEWMNEYEKFALYDIAQTCVNTLSLSELALFAGISLDDFIKEFSKKKLGYGYILGLPKFRQGVCKLYKDLDIENIVPAIGAAGANHLLFYSLIQPGDSVISVLPAYQQLYSIPASYGAEVSILQLKPGSKFLPDLSELKRFVNKNTKLICLNNPNNPTGALINESELIKIVEIAKSVNAYILCDEVYRGLGEDGEIPSIVDLYEKGISVSSMSKIFSLPGLRLGWIAAKDMHIIQECLKHREYNMISCSMFDEEVAALALSIKDVLLDRNKKIIRENLQILDEWVSKEKHFSYVKPQAGTTALLYYDFDIPSRDFCDKAARQYGVFLTPGYCFELENCVRIGFAGEKEVLTGGLEKLSEFANSLQTQMLSKRQ